MSRNKLLPIERRFIVVFMQTGSVAKTAHRLKLDKEEARKIKNRKLVRKAIKKQRDKELERLNFTKDSFVKRLRNIADCNIGDFLDWGDGKYGVTIKSKKSLTDEQLYFIDSIKPGKYGLEVKFKDQVKVMREISDILGFKAPEKYQEVCEKSSKLREPKLERLTDNELREYKRLIEKMHGKESTLDAKKEKKFI